jgi:hypothetical protein
MRSMRSMIEQSSLEPSGTGEALRRIEGGTVPTQKFIARHFLVELH